MAFYPPHPSKSPVWNSTPSDAQRVLRWVFENKIGTDHQFLLSVYKQYANGRQLTDNQMKALAKFMPYEQRPSRYAGTVDTMTYDWVYQELDAIASKLASYEQSKKASVDKVAGTLFNQLKKDLQRPILNLEAISELDSLTAGNVNSIRSAKDAVDRAAREFEQIGEYGKTLQNDVVNTLVELEKAALGNEHRLIHDHKNTIKSLVREMRNLSKTLDEY